MPLTTLDPVAALITIDLQNGIVALPLAHPAAEIVARSAQLAAAFRKRGLPVVLVNVTPVTSNRTDAGPRNLTLPEGWADLVPELDQQPTDHLVTKQRVGAFIGTGLDEILRSRGVTQVFVVGIATSIGVESTVRSAFDHGYNVVVVTDATTDRDAANHTHSIEKVFPRFAETDTTENVLKALAQ